ncbi:MAG: hypothetical protein J6B01_04435 [Ruminococcus sp.]|nr:hypothetical protein [Ruminococcus sp.]
MFSMTRSKIIAVDFDGTLCENNWPDIGEPRYEIIDYCKKQQDKGARLILWTCRRDELLENAINWCMSYGLIFDAANVNLPDTIRWMGGDSRKIFADEYIDDRMNKQFDF